MDGKYEDRESLLSEYSHYQEEKKRFLKENPIICECFLISFKDLKGLHEKDAAKNKKFLKWCFDNTHLGHGCGSCMKDCDYWEQKLSL